MVQVMAHQPVLGHNPEDKFDLSADDGLEWYVQNGYVSRVRGTEDDDFGLLATSSKADVDPTLAENREAPGKPEPHLSNVDVTPVDTQVAVTTDEKGKPTKQATGQPSGGPKHIPTPEPAKA